MVSGCWQGGRCPSRWTDGALKQAINLLYRTLALTTVLVLLFLAACVPQEQIPSAATEPVEEVPAPPTPSVPLPTALPTREPYPPGTLVSYIAQSGDTLPALASHFNTTEAE